MLITYRRHNLKKCRFRSRSEYRCKCPIWVSGTLPDGERVRKALKGRDWNRAQELVRRWEVDGDRPKKREKVTIEDWKKLFLEDADARHLSSETRRKYVLLYRQLQDLANEKGIRYVESLDLDFLTEFRSAWNDGPLSASKKLERLRSVLKFAVKRKWIDENHALHLKAPKVKQNPTLPFSDAEMEKILKAADSRIHPFALVMRHSGLRISDVTTLRVDSLDGNRLRLYTAKTGEPVSVLLPAFVADALRRTTHKNPQFFFWSGRSKVPAAVSLWRKRLADVFEKAKIEDGHSHRFRDTFAVSLLQAGVSLEDVSTLLGHQNLKITQKHYSPWVRTRQDALDRAVQAALDASETEVTR
jgi:integrase/recombinase XerD